MTETDAVNINEIPLPEPNRRFAVTEQEQGGRLLFRFEELSYGDPIPAGLERKFSGRDETTRTTTEEGVFLVGYGLPDGSSMASFAWFLFLEKNMSSPAPVSWEVYGDALPHG